MKMMKWMKRNKLAKMRKPEGMLQAEKVWIRITNIMSATLSTYMSVMIYKYMKNRKQCWILRKIQELSKIRKKKDLVGGECRH